MPYVQRGDGGALTGIYATKQPGYAVEWVDPTSDEVVAFDKAPDVKPTLSKVTILDRLNAAGLVAKAFTAMGGPGTYIYERWQAAPEMVDVTHPLITQVLDAIGADKAKILAP